MIRKPTIRQTRDIEPPTDVEQWAAPAWGKYLMITIGVIAVICIGYAVYSAMSGRKTASVPGGNVAMSTDEAQTLVNKVASHISILTGETPTVATIQDATALKGQNPDFYKDAQNGDRLLIWSDKAVLYSTTEDKILSVLPIRLPSAPEVNVAPSASLPTSSAPAVESAQIEVRNGTRTTGLAKSVADKLTAAGLTVGSYTTATKNASNTLVIVKEGRSLPTTVSRLIQLTGGKIGTLPAGEAALKGDILVIVGADYK